MFNISKKELMERWDAMPQVLKEALYSEYNFDIVRAVCKKEHLSEDKISDVATLVGDVIMGFLLPEDLAKEISEIAGLDIKIATALTQEIDRKIFSAIRNEIKENYNPLTTPFEPQITKREAIKPSPAKDRIILETIGEDKLTEEKILPVARVEEGKPLIIHEEKPAAIEETLKPVSKGFSLPFRFFKSRVSREEKPAIKATIEAPSEIFNSQFPISKEPKKDEKRVVHYSEFRTPLTPFQGKEEIIKLEKLGEMKPAETKTEKPPATPSKEGRPTNGIRLEGNIINLKKIDL